ncbi:hypothetical protein BurJ1DRAFT_4299 [Burkholderiales bacterium JOSHI_001]|nr:hypothetical protein BurJ1DRAFT_4299 [Burkholderiales bacterium JOSHI_001]
MTYQSRLLQSLDQQLQQCTDRTERSRLISRRAIHLARLNQLDEAKGEISKLRMELGTELDAGSGAWILLADGIISFFDFDIEKSFDRLRRSLGIGKSAGIISIVPLSSAWMAHIYFHKGDYESTVQNLQYSIGFSEVDDYPSRCRTAMVASNFHGFANQPDNARKWSNKARIHATAEGDEASLAALLFNITIYRVNEFRIASAFDLPLPSDYQSLLLELKSSLAFDELADGVALPRGPSILRAHTLVIEREFPEAVAMLRQGLSSGVVTFNRATVEADLAFALANIGEMEAAKEILSQARESISAAFDPDDLAFACARISGTYRMFGDLESGAQFLTQAKSHLREYRDLQEKLRLLSVNIPDPDSFE